MATALFLSLAQGTAFRKQGIVCSLSRELDQISYRKAGVLANQPNHIMRQDKHLCIHRLQHRNPNLQHLWFHEYLVFAGLQLVPKLYVRCVHLQLVVLFENQDQSAKKSPH